jgi:organic radical activating enzyme
VSKGSATVSTGIRIGIQLTESCDLACRHCATNSSPKVTSTLDRAYLFDLLSQLKEIDPNGLAAFTGGEVFYVRDLLYDAINMVRDLGLSYSVTTNGSWAVDSAERQEVLHSITDVDTLGLSADVYHATAVPKRTVGLALQEALHLGVRAVIRYTYVVGESFEKVHEELGLSTEEEKARVFFSGVQPVGRARRLDPLVFPIHPEEEPCRAASSIMIKSTGGLYGCCGESMYVRGSHDMSYGHSRSVSLRDVIATRKDNLILQAIRTVGPRKLAQISDIISDSPTDRLLANSPCGSCHLILQEANKEKVRSAAQQIQGHTRTLKALYYGEV